MLGKRYLGREGCEVNSGGFLKMHWQLLVKFQVHVIHLNIQLADLSALKSADRKKFNIFLFSLLGPTQTASNNPTLFYLKLHDPYPTHIPTQHKCKLNIPKKVFAKIINVVGKKRVCVRVTWVRSVYHL